MINLSKKLTFVLILILISSLFLINPSVGKTDPYEDWPKPSSSAPKIVSVVINNTPYYNEYDKLTQNGTIEITIENRPFTPYTDEDGRYINLRYSFQWKRYEYDVWQEHYTDAWNPLNIFKHGGGFQSLDSGYTVFTYTYGFVRQPALMDLGVFEEGVVIPFRVWASVGYYHTPVGKSDSVFVGEVSAFTVPIDVTIPPWGESGTFVIYSDSSSSNGLDGYFGVPWYVFVVLVSIIVLLVAVSVSKYVQRTIKQNPHFTPNATQRNNQLTQNLLARFL